MLTLADPLDHARRLHAGRTAVVDGDAVFDYGTLCERCARLGAALAGLGIEPGDRVAMASPCYPPYRNILTALGCEYMTWLVTAEAENPPTPQVGTHDR